MSNITFQQLKAMFANIRAQTKWDVDGEMLWGYFFTDTHRKKREDVAEHLGRSGYRVVSIYPVLHVERVEKHTPGTLNGRNAEFEKLADDFDLQCYDGMDVGPVLNE